MSYIYQIWDPIDKLIRLATLDKFDHSWNIEPTSLRQFKRIEESSDITKPTDLSDSEDEDLLLLDHIQSLDEIINESDISSLTKCKSATTIV